MGAGFSPRQGFVSRNRTVRCIKQLCHAPLRMAKPNYNTLFGVPVAPAPPRPGPAAAHPIVTPTMS